MLFPRHYIIEVLKKTFERFGFEPLETPAMEYAQTLEDKYGEEGEKLIYKFEDRGGRKIALRYDLTVPLSRLIAMYPELSKPFKRYQIAPVWRADKPQKGRLREFWQCDADIVGSEGMIADTEIIAIIYTVFKELGFERFSIRINNRKILNGLAFYGGIINKDLAIPLFRSLDKLEEIGKEGLEKELKENGFPQDVITKIFELMEIEGENGEILSELRKRLDSFPIALEGIRELEEIIQYLEEMGIGQKFYQIDPSLARGLDYYTGPIFETKAVGYNIGSLTGGGRFDELIENFYHLKFPATGTSFGLERIITVMEEGGMLPKLTTKTQVLVTVFSKEMTKESLKLAARLRKRGVNTEVYLKEDKLKKQLSYASAKGIPQVIILGPEELERGEVLIKDMSTGTQVSVSKEKVGDLI